MVPEDTMLRVCKSACLNGLRYPYVERSFAPSDAAPLRKE